MPGLGNIFAGGASGLISGATCDDLNENLSGTQLDCIQRIINLPTGDTANTYTGSDGFEQFHRGSSFFRLNSNHFYGNNFRFASAEPGSIGYHFLNPFSGTFNVNTDFVKADGTPIVVASYAAALTLMGNLIYDFQTGMMWSKGDLLARAANGGVGWGQLAQGKTEHGFQNWMFPNKNMMEVLTNEDFGRFFGSPFTYAPLNRSATQWTSTESTAGGGWVIDVNGVRTDFFAFLTNPAQAIYMRDFRNDILPPAS